MAKKTFKRELAIALLIWLAYVVEVKDVSVVEVLVWPIFAFVGAAFGFDAWGKQVNDKNVHKVPSREATREFLQEDK